MLELKRESMKNYFGRRERLIVSKQRALSGSFKTLLINKKKGEKR